MPNAVSEEQLPPRSTRLYPGIVPSSAREMRILQCVCDLMHNAKEKRRNCLQHSLAEAGTKWRRLFQIVHQILHVIQISTQ